MGELTEKLSPPSPPKKAAEVLITKGNNNRVVPGITRGILVPHWM